MKTTDYHIAAIRAVGSRERRRELLAQLKAAGVPREQRFPYTDAGRAKAEAMSAQQRNAAAAAGLPMDELVFDCSEGFFLHF